MAEQVLSAVSPPSPSPRPSTAVAAAAPPSAPPPSSPPKRKAGRPKGSANKVSADKPGRPALVSLQQLEEMRAQARKLEAEIKNRERDHREMTERIVGAAIIAAAAKSEEVKFFLTTVLRELTGNELKQVSHLL